MMVVKDLGVDGYSRWHRMYGSYSQQSTFSHKSSLLGVASIAVSVTEPVIRQIDAPIRFLLKRPRRRPN